jgi:imidazolonepropionase-like amidohydrolase
MLRKVAARPAKLNEARGLQLLAAMTVVTLSTSAANAAGIAIVGARLYANPQANAVDQSIVLVRNGLIEKVGRQGKLAIPRGYREIDARGKTLTAGYWNNHVHLVAPVFLHPLLRNEDAIGSTLRDEFTRWGFTTIFDLASTTRSALIIREMIQDRHIQGPQILTVGDPFYPAGGTPIYARPIYQAEHLESAEILSTTSAVSRVDRQAQAGVDGVKLFTGAILGKGSVKIMPAEQVRALVEAAHRYHLPVFAHPTNEAGVEDAVDNGVDILAHCTPVSGPWNPAFARSLVAKHVALIPTLKLLEVYPDPSTPKATAIQQVHAFAQAGGQILFGTDAGFMQDYDPSAEYRLMGEAIGWRAILASLTTTPANRFGQSGQRGRVEAGLAADLVLLLSDPKKDPTAFAKVSLTIRAGEIIAWPSGR